MAEQQQWFAGKPDYENFGLALASDTDAYGGHLGKARELNKRALDSAVRADSKEDGAIWQAHAALEQAAYGNATTARQTAAEALKLAPANRVVEAEVALAFAKAGDTARAESLAQDLGKRVPLDTRMQLLQLPAIQGQLALDRKNPASALNALQSASPIELGGANSCLYHVYVRGEAYLAAGQGSAAAAYPMFQRHAVKKFHDDEGLTFMLGNLVDRAINRPIVGENRWFKVEAARASRRNRSKACKSWATSSGRNFNATKRPSSVSSAL